MEIFAGLSVLVLILTAFAIALKTFALWLRTRGLPELLLAVYLSCATVTGYPLTIAMARIPASESWLLHVTATLVMSLGWVALLLFTLKVFRPGTLWARGLVGLSTCLVVTASGFYVIEATGANPRAPTELTGFILFNSLPAAIAYFWTTFEALGYYRRLRLQLRLGMAEATLVNRFLLWGLMTLAAGTALVMNMGAFLAGSFMSQPIVLVSSVLGVVHASCLFLAFHPPDWYRDWVERRAAVEGR